MCLFGGTFDPPHNAHFIIAEAIRENLDLSKIIFIPAFTPPHKHDKFPVSGIEHRLEMLRLCTQDNPAFEISDIEIRRGGISYTIDTVREMKKAYGVETEDLHLLIGSDSLAEFKTWKDWEAILEESRVIVARRPRFERSDFPDDLLKRVHFLNLPRIEISSTEIRGRFSERRMTRFYIPSVVYDYIHEHKLYGMS